MTRSAKHSPWPWLTVIAVAAAPAATAQETPDAIDFFEHELKDVELIEAIEQAEINALVNELAVGGEDLRGATLDDWFWLQNPEFEVTVQYLEDGQGG